jgi:hypothetical protein
LGKAAAIRQAVVASFQLQKLEQQLRPQIFQIYVRHWRPESAVCFAARRSFDGLFSSFVPVLSYRKKRKHARELFFRTPNHTQSAVCLDSSLLGRLGLQPMIFVSPAKDGRRL